MAASSSPRARRWPLVLLAILVVAALSMREAIGGYAITGASYGARVGCSCRYIGGRTLSDCRKDFENGMQLVMLSENEADRSVTATFPLLARQTARMVEGEGCELEPWRR
ncbi:hypothetical protein ACOYW6_10560 [Parablastomonas sp. CN1-191]|uniref:hypothetical protein n=1 Tax=Parablastomonas sp. CN1-191 TaxID=3400908 RepID=UPI003BF87ED2